MNMHRAASMKLRNLQPKGRVKVTALTFPPPLAPLTPSILIAATFIFTELNANLVRLPPPPAGLSCMLAHRPLRGIHPDGKLDTLTYLQAVHRPGWLMSAHECT